MTEKVLLTGGICLLYQGKTETHSNADCHLWFSREEIWKLWKATQFWITRVCYSMLPPNYLNWKWSSSQPHEGHGWFFKCSTRGGVEYGECMLYEIWRFLNFWSRWSRDKIIFQHYESWRFQELTMWVYREIYILKVCMRHLIHHAESKPQFRLV